MDKVSVFLLLFVSFLLLGKASAEEELLSQHEPMAERAVESSVEDFTSLEERYTNLKLEFEAQQGRLNKLQEEVVNSVGDKNPISYADWAAIILTGVAVLVTILGVLIAILSFWGYKNILKEAKSSAEMMSNRTSSDIARVQVENCINNIAKEELIKLIDKGELREHLEDAVDMIHRRHGLSGGVGGFGFGEYPEFNEEEKGE